MAWGQDAPQVGVVTTLEGQATVAHAAGTAALPLKFRDSIFERDRINTGEKSIVKVLMGGKAVVTVRELSVLTITEDLGKTTVNLSSGKIAVSVARERMKPGETLEVHTPNAVAAVRGTVFVVDVGTNTVVTTIHGAVGVGLLGNLANSAVVNTLQQVDITGRQVGKVIDVTQQEVTRALGGLGGSPLRGPNGATVTALFIREQQKGLVVAAGAGGTAIPLQNTLVRQQNLPPGGCGGTVCANTLRVAPPPPPPPPPPPNPAVRPK